ncbi:ABC transporter [Nakaseomyces glabratus]
MSKSVLKISNALFRSSLMKNVPPVFSKPVKDFEILTGEKWVIWGNGKAKFMNVLSNKYLCDPPLSLQYNVSKDGVTLPRIEQVQFKGAIPTAHLSARYEFFKDEFDQTCKKFILDNAIGSNAVEYDVSTTDRVVDMGLYDFLVRELKLEELQNRWAMGLSNGQMRRARLARSLLKQPDLILVDDPFLGLDPTATAIISKFLSNWGGAGKENSYHSPVVIGLRYQDTIPSWCTHICCVDPESGIKFQGPINEYRDAIENKRASVIEDLKNAKMQRRKEIGLAGASEEYSIDDLISPHPMYNCASHEMIKMPPTIELKGLGVTYKGEPVLENLHWQVKPGSKWHIRGDNGTGKSTLLSLLTAEHPQSWNSKVVENGEPRRTGKSNYFDINSRIGMSSPELHAIILNNCADRLTVREFIATGFHQGSSNNFLPLWDKLDDSQKRIVDMYMNYFELDLIARDKTINQLSVSEQKLALLVRSLVKMPEILVLDEAFSGMEVTPMLKCHEFLDHWPGTVLVVAHVAEETPACHHYLRLISPGQYEIGDIA